MLMLFFPVLFFVLFFFSFAKLQGEGEEENYIIEMTLETNVQVFLQAIDWYCLSKA